MPRRSICSRHRLASAARLLRASVRVTRIISSRSNPAWQADRSARRLRAVAPSASLSSCRCDRL
eukprot:2121938-Prymnesium_polylepis.2